LIENVENRRERRRRRMRRRMTWLNIIYNKNIQKQGQASLLASCGPAGLDWAGLTWMRGQEGRWAGCG
jgi:hypothetical protein